MLTTSVNEAGNVPLNEYDEIVKIYSNKVDKIYPNDRESLNLASTVVLTRVFSDNKLLHTPTGHAAIGWLILEDLFTILVLVLAFGFIGFRNAKDLEEQKVVTNTTSEIQIKKK